VRSLQKSTIPSKASYKPHTFSLVTANALHRTHIYRVLADFLPPDRAELRDRLPTEQSSKALCSSGIRELLRLLSRRPCVSSWSKPPAILTASIALSKSEDPLCWDSPRCACLCYDREAL
jgi:hypothetical protein